MEDFEEYIVVLRKGRIELYQDYVGYSLPRH